MTRHIPIMGGEILNYFKEIPVPSTKPVFVLDATLGGGGHTEMFLAAGTNVRVVAMDRDKQAIERAKVRFQASRDRLLFLHANFSEVGEIFSEPTREIQQFFGSDEPVLFHQILADLGISSDQLDDPERGFSFLRNGPLDMRMDTSSGLTASDILNSSSFAELVSVFRHGELGHFSRPLAEQVIHSRPISTTFDFAEICRKVIHPSRKGGRSLGVGRDPATVPFQAVRREVNREYFSLKYFLVKLPDLMRDHGRLSVISFHSLEDGEVARAMRNWARKEPVPGLPGAEKAALGVLLTKKSVTPSHDETNSNPRARSARLRVFERQLTLRSGEMYRC